MSTDVDRDHQSRANSLPFTRADEYERAYNTAPDGGRLDAMAAFEARAILAETEPLVRNRIGDRVMTTHVDLGCLNASAPILAAALAAFLEG